MRRKTLRQVVVVNLGAPLSYFSEVANLFGLAIDEMTIYNAGFCDFGENAIR